MRPQWRWLPRSPWRGVGTCRTRRMFVPQPIVAAEAGSLCRLEVVRPSRWSMDRSPRAHREAASRDRSDRQRRGPAEGIASAPSSAAVPRHGSLGRSLDEHESREAGHWYRSQCAAYGRRCASLRRSRAARQPAWLVHFDCRSRRLLAWARALAFFAPAGQVHGRSSATYLYLATRKSNPAPSNQAELMRQRSPLAARRQDIESRLHNTAQIGPARPAAPFAAATGARSAPIPHRSYRLHNAVRPADIASE